MMWLPFGLTLLIGAAGITRQAWRDEHATWWASTLPFDEFLKLVSHVDVVLAPYYLFMRAWIYVAGDSVIAMRLPSLLAMATAAMLTARLGSKLFTPVTGLTAGCLLAVIPSVSRYAEEARPYAFVMCFAVASILALVNKRYVLVGLFVLLTGLSHLIALLVLLAHLPLVRDWKRWLTSVSTALVLLLPLSIVGIRQTGQVSWIDASVKSLVTLPQSLTRSAVTAGILAALALLAVVGTAWSRELTALITWAVAPPLVLFVAAHDLFYYRYLLFTLPAWVLLAASATQLLAPAPAPTALPSTSATLARSAAPPVPLAISPDSGSPSAPPAASAMSPARSVVRAGPRGAVRQKVAAAALCAAVLVLGIRDHIGLRKSPLPGDQDYQAAAAYVAAHADPGDVVVFDGFEDQRERFGFAYEWRHQQPPGACATLQTCAAQRIWLVRNKMDAVPPGFTASVVKPFSGLELVLLTPAR